MKNLIKAALFTENLSKNKLFLYREQMKYYVNICENKNL